MSSQSVLLKAKGIHSQPNSLSSVPEGALLEADNVIIDRDSVIQPRRGFKLYGDEISGNSTRASELLAYKDRLIRHYSTTLDVDNGSGTFTSLSSTFSAPSTALRIKSQEVNGNLYITSSEGIKKISASSASQITSSNLSISGGVKALDFTASISVTGTGFLDSTGWVSYRVVWGIKDNNSNLILGSPSAQVIINGTAIAPLGDDVSLTITIPQEVTTAHFLQVYRTAISSTEDGVGDEHKLVLEQNPTEAEITARSMTVLDELPESLADGANLYTNPNSGEGILQANEPPPFAKDLALFKNSLFFGNTQTKEKYNFTLIGVADFVAGTSSVTITDGTTTNTYTFKAVENAAAKEVYFNTGSTSTTVAQDIDDTARSLVRVINKNASDIVYAYYLSGSADLPGQILLETRDIDQGEFYLYVNNTATAGMFNPTLPIQYTISSNSIAASTEITTSATHTLRTGDVVVITGSNSTPSINGTHTITYVSTTKFTIPVTVTVAGSAGTITPKTQKSDNEISLNRVYYSKFQQPEAVPIVNYFDIGPKDQEIKRIIALRDGLFIFKVEGIYRLSGEFGSFTVSLFDNGTLLTAPDSAVVLNNQIYCLTDQGIGVVSDTGVSIVSRPIEDKFLKLNLPTYTAYSTATFGVAYESDRSYYLWTVENTSDTVATQCYRYNVFTNSFTRYPISKTCGIISPSDDKMYLGAGDINYIEQERKSFSRFDYADREVIVTPQFFNDNTLIFTDISDFEVGDVLYQQQYLTIYEFNKLLKKLDLDSGVADSDYFSTLEASAGDNLRSKVTSLATKLDADTGVSLTNYSSLISGYGTTFANTQSAFNVIVNNLIIDSNVVFLNYDLSSGTKDFEVVIESINANSKTITIPYTYPFIDGDLTLYQRISTNIVWAPQFFGDVSVSKQIREATVIFERNNFSIATLSFASDLNPGYSSIDFTGSGNGIYGSGVYGEKSYGGYGNSIPFRTYVPKDKQRCRYITCKFEHAVAREAFSIFGLSLTANTNSERAFR